MCQHATTTNQRSVDVCCFFNLKYFPTPCGILYPMSMPHQIRRRSGKLGTTQLLDLRCGRTSLGRQWIPVTRSWIHHSSHSGWWSWMWTWALVWGDAKVQNQHSARHPGTIHRWPSIWWRMESIAQRLWHKALCLHSTSDYLWQLIDHMVVKIYDYYVRVPKVILEVSTLLLGLGMGPSLLRMQGLRWLLLQRWSRKSLSPLNPGPVNQKAWMNFWISMSLKTNSVAEHLAPHFILSSVGHVMDQHPKPLRISASNFSL